MREEKTKKFFSVLFLAIFCLKMLISIAPLLIAHFDRTAVNAVIMQLEIENNAKQGDVKEATIKEFLTFNNSRLAFSHPVIVVLPSMICVDHDKHLQAFYPSVPTPPPNNFC